MLPITSVSTSLVRALLRRFPKSVCLNFTCFGVRINGRRGGLKVQMALDGNRVWGIAEMGRTGSFYPEWHDRVGWERKPIRPLG